MAGYAWCLRHAYRAYRAPVRVAHATRGMQYGVSFAMLVAHDALRGTACRARDMAAPVALYLAGFARLHSGCWRADRTPGGRAAHAELGERVALTPPYS